MDVRVRLGRNISRLRLKKGLGQEKFTFQYELDRTYVSGIKRGFRNPTIVSVQKLADGLGVPIAALLSEIDGS